MSILVSSGRDPDPERRGASVGGCPSDMAVKRELAT